ncbi:MAG: hypothetical protein JO290_13800, partial [Sphingomonadaceae bacterium]|nr:hypothetical protein [Sphingomonadaceae bacterium]
MTPSLLWLLRHELRLAVRGVAGHGPWIKRMGPRLLLAAIPLVAGIALAVANAGGRQPSSEALLDDLGGLIAAAVVLLGVLMISTAAAAVLRTFYDRHDLDLLLAAPVPPARVMAAKAVGVAVIVATPFLVVFAPYTITSALLGSPRWLAALAIVPIDATLATAAAMALTAGLFAAIGPRRARVAVQLIAAVTGGSIFLLSQVQSFSPEGAKSAFSVLSHRWAGPLDGLAQAAVGRPLPLLVLAALAALAFRAAA